MSTEEHFKLCKSVFETASFCRCSSLTDGYVYHPCGKFEFHDVEHSQSCQCCQTHHFTYFLGVLMERLAKEGKLSAFYENALSRSKISHRIFDLERAGSRLLFKIDRHQNARDLIRLNFVKQRWQFDFGPIKLELLHTEEDHAANYEFLQKYILKEE